MQKFPKLRYIYVYVYIYNGSKKYPNEMDNISLCGRAKQLYSNAMIYEVARSSQRRERNASTWPALEEWQKDW